MESETFYIRGTPRPASRPRVGKYSTYYEKPYTEWRKSALEQLGVQDEHMFDGPIYVDLDVLSELVVVHVRSLPASWRPKGVQGDLDNYFKAVADVLQEARIIENDKQVHALRATMSPT